MKYITRSGIVLVKIKDEYLLVSSKALQDDVPYITIINETAAFCWKQLENGISENELILSVMTEYDFEDSESITKDISQLVEQLFSKGFLVKMA